MEESPIPTIVDSKMSEPLALFLEQELQTLQKDFPDEAPVFSQLERLLSQRVSLKVLLLVSQMLPGRSPALEAQLTEVKKRTKPVLKHEKSEQMAAQRMSNSWYKPAFSVGKTMEKSGNHYRAWFNLGQKINANISPKALREAKYFADREVMVRIHSQCIDGESFGSHLCDCGEQLDTAKKMIEAHGCGLVLYLMQEGRGAGANKKHQAQLLSQSRGISADEAMVRVCGSRDLRSFNFVPEILKDLGFDKSSRITLISDNKVKAQALKLGGFEVSMLSAAGKARSLTSALEILEKALTGDYSKSFLEKSGALDIIRHSDTPEEVLNPLTAEEETDDVCVLDITPANHF